MRQNAVADALTKAQESYWKDVLAKTIGSLPGKTTMGELVDSFRGEAEGGFREMTLREFVAYSGGASPRRGRPSSASSEEAAPSRRSSRSSGSAKSWNTRTEAGRIKLDEAIAAFLAENSPARAEAIREGVGGTAAQLRQGLTRLMDAKSVRKKGQRRATEYHWKG